MTWHYNLEPERRLDKRKRQMTTRFELETRSTFRLLAVSDTIFIEFLFERYLGPDPRKIQLFLTLDTNLAELPCICIQILQTLVFIDDITHIFDPSSQLENWILRLQQAQQEQINDSGNISPDNIPSSSPLPSVTASRALSLVSLSLTKIILDSSSDEESTNVAATKMTTSYHRDKKYATLTQQGSNKPCEISDGIILPALLHDFDRKQANYCDQKDIAVADQVRKSLSCFMENKDADHKIDNQREDLEKLEWKPFIAKMKEMVLQDGWEKLLDGTLQHQDDSQLRTIVTAGVPDVLRPHAFEITATSYGAWSSTLIAKIKKNDELGELLAASNAHNTQAIAHTQDMSNMNVALKRYPPKLTPPEIFWLDLYQGCCGCRRFDIQQGHQAFNCDTPEHLKASGDNYQLCNKVASTFRIMDRRQSGLHSNARPVLHQISALVQRLRSCWNKEPRTNKVLLLLVGSQDPGGLRQKGEEVVGQLGRTAMMTNGTQTSQ
ncbi:hypothetical protein C8J56DRAFT_893492 [Mycena floridula]|nr:hypothetical protein C8J56DRAFT_893492 [Mycena floridula]